MQFNLSKYSLFFFLLVALLGTTLRASMHFDLPFEFDHLVHAHSHVAFQGWIYTAMMLLLCRFFLNRDQFVQGRYLLQFKLTIVVVVGVLISFSLQGYALYSIIFSTMFQLLNYWFIYRFLKDVRNIRSEGSNMIPLRFITAGLWLGILSTLVPFGVGILSAKDMSNTEAYRSLVYTFLHLQYNGWFLFVALGLFFKMLHDRDIEYNRKRAGTFFNLFAIAVIPAIALSLLGMSYARLFIQAAAVIASILLGLGLLLFALVIRDAGKAILNGQVFWQRVYLLIFIAAFFVKGILQCISVFPAVKQFAFFNKPVLLAYLHLSLIGVISFLLLALLYHVQWLKNDRFSNAGNVLLIAGFATTESLLAAWGIGLPYQGDLLLAGSAAMAFGLLILLFNRSGPVEIHRSS